MDDPQMNNPVEAPKASKRNWYPGSWTRRTNLIAFVILFAAIASYALYRSFAAGGIILNFANLDSTRSTNATVIVDSKQSSKRNTQVIELSNGPAATSAKAFLYSPSIASGVYQVCMISINANPAVVSGAITVNDYKLGPVQNTNSITQAYTATLTTDYKLTICFSYSHDATVNAGIAATITNTTSDGTLDIGSIVLQRTSDLPPPPPPSTGNQFGIATGAQGWPNKSELTDGTFQKQIDEMASAGVHWVRMSFPWSSMEPNAPVNGVHTYQFNQALSVAQVLNSKGMEAVVTFENPPSWSTTSSNYGCSGAAPFAFKPEDYASYAENLVTALKNYPNIKAWEMGNEPNHTKAHTWPHPNACEYTKLAQMTYKAVKTANPNAIVLSAGIGGTAGKGTDVDPDAFISQMYDLNGGTSNGLFDAVAYHPYSWPNSPLQDAKGLSADHLSCSNLKAGVVPGPVRGWCRMLVARQIMVNHGDSAKKIWLTEFGVGAYPAQRTGWTPAITDQRWSEIVARFLPPDLGILPNPIDCFETCNPVHNFLGVGSANTQATMIAQAYQTAASYDWAGPLFYFTFYDKTSPQNSDNGNGSTNGGDFMGLVDFNGNHKPAFTTYQTLSSQAGN